MGNLLMILGFLGFLFSVILLGLSISAVLLEFLSSKFNVRIERLNKLKDHKLLSSKKNIVIMLISSIVLLGVGAELTPTDSSVDVQSDAESVAEVQADEEDEVDEQKEKADQEHREKLEKEAAEKQEQEEKREQAIKEKEKKKLEEEKRLEEEEEKRVEEEKEKERVEEEKKRVKEEKEKELTEANPNKTEQIIATNSTQTVPSGKSYIVVNNNIPFFTNEDITSTDVYHTNGAYDSLGRVTVANSVVGVEIMPAEERGSIGHIEPSGWNQSRYAGINAGGWLYNRSHLIGHQMTGNDDPQNIMTGTRSFNMAMLEFENFVANYVETTENLVRYRVTPVFEGNNLVASGIYMEGFSIEDNGEGIMFNIFVANRQPNIEINYADGSSVGPAGPAENGKITKHKGSQKNENPKTETPKTETPKSNPTPPAPSAPAEDLSAVDTNGNGKVTIQEAKDAGFKMPIYDDHWLYKYMDDRNNNGMVGE